MAEPQRTTDTVRNAADKAQATISETAETARQGCERFADGANRTAETARDTWNRASNAGSRVASQGLDFGAQAVSAYVEAGKRASAKLTEANKALTESYSRQLADYSDLSQRAVAIRSPGELIQVQQEALRKLKTGFDSLTQVYGLFIDALTDSLQPIAENAASARDRFQGSLPA
ncbi:MAG: hypothetical protein JF615_02955 [Asticcacaulis sp.]|nr:hypothetical protein [Asticcacaulis sp.]